MSVNGEGKFDILSTLSNGNINHMKSTLEAELEISNVNTALNSNNDTALVYYARDGNPEILEYILKKAADVNFGNIDGETPLLAAIKSKKAENAIFLIRHGADVDCKDQKGCSALIAACQNGLKGVVQEILDKGVNVNYRDNSGWTALTWSVFSLKRKSFDIVKTLLDANADVCFRYDSIGTIYDFAKRLYCEEVAQLICEYEEKPEETISDWEYLKDQIQNKWTLTRDIANILDRCHSLRAFPFVVEQKKMDLADFLSQTPEEMNELPTLTHRKQHLNRILRKFHLQQWNIECLGIDFVKNVAKQEVSALAQITFLASVARQLMVMSGSVGYIQKNLHMPSENENSKKMLLALAETEKTLLLVKGALIKVLQTVKADKVYSADWIPLNPHKKRRKKLTVATGIVFTLSIVFVCWEGYKLSKLTGF